MRLLIERLLQALEDAGFRVRKSGSPAMLRLDAACTAVGLQSAVCTAMPQYVYLGLRECEDGGTEPLYGAKLDAEVALQITAPRPLGDEACMTQADALIAFLAGGIDGIRMTGFTLGAFCYDADSDTVSRTLLLRSTAYVYATANEDETEFTDFILKGELQ